MTKIDYRWAVTALALLAAGCGKPADSPADGPSAGAGPIAANAPAGGWTEAVSATADGGFLMGNPAAPVKLVEYSSMTCPHCAQFSADALPVLKANYIATGKVSLEMRNFVRDPVDVTASLIARCAGAGPYFKMTEQMYAGQTEWIGRYQTISEAEQRRIGALAEAQQYEALAKAGGLDRFAQERGIPAEKVSQCLADLKARDQLVTMNKAAVDDYKITGTPSFLINGELVANAFDWSALEPKLKAAVGS